MREIPHYLKDANMLLSRNGFITSHVWYHGTSSSLVDSILSAGLKRSGDHLMNEAAKSTMATIGNTYRETTEPVFLTPSKELAYYWAQQTVRRRRLRVDVEESPVVFAIALTQEQHQAVRPDVGAASLLMIKDGQDYLEYVAALYQHCQAGELRVESKNAPRLDYLNKLGMAYINEDIKADFISLVSE